MHSSMLFSILLELLKSLVSNVKYTMALCLSSTRIYIDMRLIIETLRYLIFDIFTLIHDNDMGMC